MDATSMQVSALSSLIRDDELIEFSPTAKRLDICDRTLHRWVATGYAPPHIKLGKRVLFRLSTIETWLKSLEERPTELARKPVANHRAAPTAPAVSRRRNRRREAVAGRRGAA